MEEELAAKLEIIEKLRTQVKELEKEKRETIRRYNEQVRSASSSFDPQTAYFISLGSCRQRLLKQRGRRFMIVNSISNLASKASLKRGVVLLLAVLHPSPPKNWTSRTRA